MKTIVSILTAAVFFLPVGPAAAQSPSHVIQAPAETQWGPAPPVVPAGAQIAVLAGDPTKSGAYTVRLKFPPNYAIPAHAHPTDENVVVTSGALTLGMGDKLVKGSGGRTLKNGGYGLLPAGMNHFAYTGAEETTIVLFGLGPLEFKYVNPADDPRNAANTK